jgi:hypothetical protein
MSRSERRKKRRSRERVILLPPLPKLEDVVDPMTTETYYFTKEERKLFPRGRHAANWRLGMQNIRMRVEGSRLILEVDLNGDFGIPEGRRNVRVASSKGPKPIPSEDYPLTFFLLNVYRFPPRTKFPHLGR